MRKIQIEEQEKLQRFYNNIIEEKLGNEAIQGRVNIIHYLEKATGQDFKGTKDFKEKMERFFIGADKTKGTELKEARKKKGLSQEALAAHLDVSRVYLAQMESNRKPLNTRGIRFLLENAYA